MEISHDLRANVEVNGVRAVVKTGPRLIDIDEVRDLSKLTLRLEALCSAQHAPDLPGTPIVAGSPALESTPSKRSHTKTIKPQPPSHLGPSIKDEMSDDDLAGIIESLTTRIENCLSTMVCRYGIARVNDADTRAQYMKHLGGFASVLAALEQATRIDQKLIVHAMALMNGAVIP